MGFDYSEAVPYLLDWYDFNARILPWRNFPVPYEVWISEIMLQQTRVEAVKGYYDRFTAELPNIQALAEVEEEKLLKLWEGLGYYSRVRNLQKAARIVMSDYGGKLPVNYDDLLKLPGIGTYTAGAIASIAFHKPVPAIDGNVLRAAKRMAGNFDDISKDKVIKELWSSLEAMIPRDRPGDFNQAFMELGATICLPNGKPFCEKCPVMHLCRAFHDNLVMQIPVKPVKSKRKVIDRTILLIEFRDKIALQKRAPQGLLAGLWELPGFEGKIPAEDLPKLMKDFGFTAETILPLGEAKHIFTHIEWHMTGYHIILSDCRPQKNAEGILWADRGEIHQRYGIPNAFSFYLKYFLGNL